MSRSYREALGAERGGRRRSTTGGIPTVEFQRWSSTGGIPPVKCRPLADRSCTSGAIRRIDHAVVSPPGGQVTTKTTQIRASYCLKVAPLDG